MENTKEQYKYKEKLILFIYESNPYVISPLREKCHLCIKYVDYCANGMTLASTLKHIHNKKQHCLGTYFRGFNWETEKTEMWEKVKSPVI